MLSAWKLAKPFGPLERWSPGPDLLLASWIASGVGAGRLSAVLDWKNWRADRQHPHYYFQALFSRLRWQSPVRLLPEIDRRLEPSGGAMVDDDRSDLMAFKAWALGTLRDFSRATETITEALAITPDRAWTHVQHASLLEMRDRYEEALEAARQALALRPVYRPAVLQVTDCLVHLGRDDEAIQLLVETHRRTENGAFATRLQAFYSEREDYQNALWCLDQAEPLMPLMPKATREWFAGRRADFLYMAGDIDACLEWCDRAPEKGFQQMVASKLRCPGARSRARKRLAVPFTRQHNMTCAPATLASLARFWNREHDHLDIATAICHDGTPWHKERAWAESNGFIAREFSFTREILIALIDRGVPFTLTTSWATGAHLQACIGYDERQDVALLRDPTHRHFGETLIEGLIEAHPTQGPRCMLLLPLEEAPRLDGLSLPDEALFDAQRDLAVALDNHDRWAAQTAVITLRAINPDHPLTLTGEASLAAYLGHHEKRLQLVTRLAARFPDHQATQFALLVACQAADDPASARSLLDRAVGSKACDPVFVSELGEWLLSDARQLALAGHFLRRALRLRPSEGRSIESLARYEMKSGRFEETARLRRFAATLSPNWEPYARACFDSHRITGRSQEALGFLRERVDLHGERSAGPWLTLAQALDSIHRDEEARAVLEEAIACMPDEGDLKLQAGRMMICWGEQDRAIGLGWIDQARGKVAETVWLRARANVAEFLGDRPLARRLWNTLIERQPQAVDAHRSLAVLIAEENGRQSAVDFINQATRRSPRLPGLWTLLADWMGGDAPGSALPALDQALSLDPDDVWILRDRAVARFNADLRDLALEDANEAIARAPRAPESHGVLASFLQRSGKTAEALAALREALHLRIDYSYGIENLVEWSPDSAAAREALNFIAEEMRRQVLTGQSLLDYQDIAAPVLPRELLLDQLREACNERPDLWQAWSARINQCLAMDLGAEARQCSEQLATAFPLLPRTWVEVAKVERNAGNHPQEADALQRAVELSPAWDWAARQLGEVLERLGHYDQALATLELAIRHNPLNGANHGCLADLLYKTGKRDEAFSRLLGAIPHDPLYQWGWRALARWGLELKRSDATIAAVQATSLQLAHKPQWWVIASDVWAALERPDDAIAATRAGLAIDAKHADLRDQLARMLGNLGRFDEALAACQCDADETVPPKELEGRRAWLLMESGQTLAALRVMETLVEREPDYAWGWELLSEWHAARKDWSNTKTAAIQWTRLCPDDAAAHGHLGLAARELRDLTTSRRAFERAFRLDPAYAYAGRELLKLQSGKNDLLAAQATLATLQHYAPGEWTDCDAIALALREQRNAFPAAEALLCASASVQALLRVNQLFVDRGLDVAKRWRKRVEQLVVAGAAVSPAALAAWADLFKHDIPRAARKLRRFKLAEASRNAAWDCLLNATRALPDQAVLHALIRKNRQRFHADATLWNTTGKLLLVAGCRKAAAKWLGDWQQRSEGVGAHTLVNLASALDGTTGPLAAAGVRAEGIKRFPASEDNLIYLMAGQAAWLAESGRFDEAAALLEMVDDRRISDHHSGLAALARSIIAASARDETEARRHYQIALGKLSAWNTSRAVKNHLRPAQQTLARLLPWAANKRRRVTKAWGGGFGAGWKKSDLIGLIAIGIVLLAVFAFILSAAVIGTGSWIFLPALAVLLILTRLSQIR